jgi:cold-inducible RNA-binding protein
MSRLSQHEPTTHEEMLVNMYVSNLAYTTTEDELSQLFEAYGTVESVRIITDRATGRSPGFAFVEMPNGTEARAAMAGLNGTSLGERTLTVNEARPRDDRGGGQREPRRPRWQEQNRRDMATTGDVSDGEPGASPDPQARGRGVECVAGTA